MDLEFFLSKHRPPKPRNTSSIPISPPSGPTQWLFEGPPAESKFLAVNPILETPALDKLHNESIRFEAFHVTPYCTPTRGQLMTGIDGMRSKCSAVLEARFIPKRDLIMMPQLFKDNGYTTGLFGKWHLGNNYYKDKVENQRVTAFLGMIRNIDTNMANFEEWMVSRGLRDNTIVISMGDNGTALGESVYNAGLERKKWSIYEGGHRAPCFIRWPNGNLIFPQNISTTTQIQDILPSLIELAQLNNATNATFDGTSLAPLLKGDLNAIEDRKFVIQVFEAGAIQGKDNYNRDYKYNGTAVWDKWRLVFGDELYDVTNDLAQTTNVASKNPDVANAMKTYYEEWWSDIPKGDNQITPLLVDLKNENPVELNSAMWETNAVNTQWNVASALGRTKGGKMHLYIAEAGAYQIQLSRWPFELNQSLTTRGISHAIGGTTIPRGVALPIEYGAIQLGSGAVITNKKTNSNSTQISFNVNLNKGATTLHSWFKDAELNNICGAFYVRIGEAQGGR